MAPRIKKTYTKEFRIEAVNLAKELDSYATAARQLGIEDSLMYSWKRRYNFSIESESKSTHSAISEAEEKEEYNFESYVA